MLRRLKCWIWFDSLDCLDCMQLVLCCNLVMNPVLLNESFFSYFSSLKWSSFTFLLAFGDALLLFSLAPSYLFYFLFPSLSLSFWLKRSSCTFFFFVGSWMCAFNIDAFCPYPSPTFLYSFPTRNFKSTWFHWKVAAIILGSNFLQITIK